MLQHYYTHTHTIVTTKPTLRTLLKFTDWCKIAVRFLFTLLPVLLLPEYISSTLHIWGDLDFHHCTATNRKVEMKVNKSSLVP